LPPQLTQSCRAVIPKCRYLFERVDGEHGLRTIGAALNGKRTALLRRLKRLEHGDTLIVRSLRDLITMLDDLRARGVKFHSLTEAIDTGRLGTEFDF